LGIVLPFMIWLYVAAIVFYVHHTDLDTRWYDDKDEWRAAQPNLEGTRSIQLPLRLDVLLHHVMKHTAHHVNAAIPCYRLAAAQRALELQYPEEVALHRITVRRYIEITRRCQLYDTRLHRWVRFAELESGHRLSGIGIPQSPEHIH
jgi:acyl-lipid omega-6 desaturase (Delta-12 desaturase)